MRLRKGSTRGVSPWWPSGGRSRSCLPGGREVEAGNDHRAARGWCVLRFWIPPGPHVLRPEPKLHYPAGRAAVERLNSIYAELEARGREFLLDAGVALTDMQFIRSADMRYAGQGFEISVGLPGGEYGPGQVDEFRRSFEKEYQDIYQRPVPEIPIESVNWRLVATGPRPQVGAGTWWSKGVTWRSPEGKRRVYLPGAGEGTTRSRSMTRYRLPVGIKNRRRPLWRRGRALWLLSATGGRPGSTRRQPYGPSGQTLIPPF